MQLTAGPLTWEWIDHWDNLPKHTDFAHHALVIDKQGRIISGHPIGPKVCIFNTDGELQESFDVPVADTHGLWLADDDEHGEILYIADVAKKAGVKNGEQGKIVACTLTGEVLATLTPDNIPNYNNDDWFSPTAVATDPRNGDIWVTDGYGTHKVYCFTKDFKWKLTLDGTEGAGKFNCPHWIYMDLRKETPEVYVADRGSDRVQVFSTDGNFLRTFGEGEFHQPSVFTTFNDYMVIGELEARLIVLDKDDKVVGFLGDGRHLLERPGWPNRKDDSGKNVPPKDYEIGTFNSPHGLTADKEGNLYVAEWVLGGRNTKLKIIS